MSKKKNAYVQFCSMQPAPLVFQDAQVQNPSAVDKELKRSSIKIKNSQRKKCQEEFDTKLKQK